MVSIWDKIGVAVKKGVKVTGNVAALVPQMLTYPVRKSNASWGQMKHDTKVALKEAVGMNVPEEEREYDPPIETTKASENFGVEIKEQKEKGKIAFLASRTLTGDIPYLNDVQLCKIKAGFPNITIFREENKVVIEVDVESIIKKVKEDSPVADEKTIKKLVLEGIYNEVDRNFKGLANITGGELKIHTDRKLLHGIAEKLYKEYSNQTDSKKSMSEEKLSQVIKELGNEFLSLADASGETIKPLSTPTVKEGVSDETIKSL